MILIVLNAYLFFPRSVFKMLFVSVISHFHFWISEGVGGMEIKGKLSDQTEWK